MNYISTIIFQILALIVRIRIALLGFIFLYFSILMIIYHPKIDYDTLYTITKGTTIIFALILIDTVIPRRFKLKILKRL